jgi:hypothetical protein
LALNIARESIEQVFDFDSTLNQVLMPNNFFAKICMSWERGSNCVRTISQITEKIVCHAEAVLY